MVVRVATIAFEGIEARPVDVQVQLVPGQVAFMVVGLGDKAVAESRERVRGALMASGLAMPARRVIINLAPADSPKKAVISICRLRWPLWRPWAPSLPMLWRAIRFWGNSRSTARSHPSRDACPQLSPPMRADMV